MLKLLAWIFFILVIIEIVCKIFIWVLQKFENEDEIDLIEATKNNNYFPYKIDEDQF